MLSAATGPRRRRHAHRLVRNVIAEARSFGTGGTYLNFDAPDEGEAPRLVEAAFGENLAHLRVVKRTYDPENLFQLNANITPDT